MPPQRSTLLLILLVTMPLALLAWLGTYLIRDAERRTDAAMQAILAERLSVANHQIVNDLRQLTDRLDSWAPATDQPGVATVLRRHPWVTTTWETTADGEVLRATKRDNQPVAEADRGNLLKEIRPLLESLSEAPPATVQPPEAAVAENKPFAPVPEDGHKATPDDLEDPEAGDKVYQKTVGYHLGDSAEAVQTDFFSSGLQHIHQYFLYWRRLQDGSLVIAFLDGPKLMTAIFNRLPPPGLEQPPGRMELSTGLGIILHQWGARLPGSEEKPEASRRLSEPLGAWVLSYTPANQEFPKPYLFPIVLGVGSGTLLVLALAYLYFHETSREIRVAQQRVTFVNQISHELRTPLTNIQLYAEMAHARIEESGDRIAIRHLGVVQAETSRLNRLIQNVLNYARQQRNKLTVQTSDVTLDDILTRVIEHWKPLLETKGFEIEVDLAAPPLIKADADAVEQILGNLISNVDKYAAFGKWIRIESRATEHYAEISVKDRGPGIPGTKRRSVFEPFERLRSDLTEGVSGTGIGLTIARELAQLHGGSLTVSRTYKDGACFLFQLPLPKQP